MAVRIVPEIEFGPGGVGLKIVRPPSLATTDVGTQAEVAWWEVAILWVVVMTTSFALVKWLLWPAARWAIVLLGW